MMESVLRPDNMYYIYMLAREYKWMVFIIPWCIPLMCGGLSITVAIIVSSEFLLTLSMYIGMHVYKYECIRYVSFSVLDQNP